jgi:uncharacterized protein (TIGR04551 family)
MAKSLVLSMPYSTRRHLLGIATIVLLSFGVSSLAEAQITPGMPGGPGGGQQPAGEEKKEGVAEAAPKTPGLLPTTPALPAPKGRRKKWKLFELEGYYRLRTDWFKNFHLGFQDRPDLPFADRAALGGAPFPRALNCYTTRNGAGCDNALSSTNMRLRLEPTINLDEGTSVHVQADVLDNLVLGSTPATGDYGFYKSADLSAMGTAPPLGAFGDNQQPPVAGKTSDRDSILVKRAWAEVAVPLGIIKVGRMPNHWGMGIYYNGGGFDPINGTYDLDADYGDTVDRASFSAVIPGTNLRAMIATDWVTTRLASNQTNFGLGREGHPYDLDDSDDGNAWVAVLSRMDSPQEFRDRVDRGELAFNYGVYFEYKTQSQDVDLTDFQLGGVFDVPTHYLPRGLKTYSPDAWAKLGFGRVTLEGEVIAQLGKIDRIDELGFDKALDIRTLGGAGRLSWHGLDGKLRLGFEGGFASGDQHDNLIQGNTNIAFANVLGDKTDHRLTEFFFNRDYKVDMILWRHLYGAVTNAGYAKPSLAYDLTKSITFKVANVTSFAINKVATPGNGTMYGTEFDSDLGYASGGFYAGVSYGVLFPFGAMAHLADLGYGTDPTTGAKNVGDGGTAHTIQSRLVLQF